LLRPTSLPDRAVPQLTGPQIDCLAIRTARRSNSKVYIKWQTTAKAMRLTAWLLTSDRSHYALTLNRTT